MGYFLDNDEQITNLIDIGSGTGWFVNYVSLNYPTLSSIFAKNRRAEGRIGSPVQ